MGSHLKVLIAINVIIGIISFIALVLSSIVHLSERFINQNDHLHDSLRDEYQSNLQTITKKLPTHIGILEGSNNLQGASWAGSSGMTVSGMSTTHNNSPFGASGHTPEAAFKFEMEELKSFNYAVVATPVDPAELANT